MSTPLAIIISVIGGLLLASILFAIKSRFGTQPKIQIRLQGGVNSSTSGHPGNIRITWNKRLELYNPTTFPALGILFIWPEQNRALPVSEPKHPHVNPTETSICEFKVVKEFPYDKVTACHDRFSQLLPEELQAFVLIVKYTNAKDISFYTRYEKKGDNEYCTYHRIKPKK